MNGWMNRWREKYLVFLVFEVSVFTNEDVEYKARFSCLKIRPKHHVQ